MNGLKFWTEKKAFVSFIFLVLTYMLFKFFIFILFSVHVHVCAIGVTGQFSESILFFHHAGPGD